MEERVGLTWIIDTRPKRQLGTSALIRLHTNTQGSGTGRLAQIVTLRKHWATFSIIGSQTTCNLRVPIPWAQLDALQSHAHTTHYTSLPALPRPHHSFLHLPPFLSDSENPYEFEVWDDGEEESAQLSLTRITNALRHTRNRARKSAAATEPSNGVTA
ncbi:uncharacterized protein B0H18DRAFT_1117401 [Fomitopsis serialis]|uniref:uncharacterized protein n=1 Tax=Fomitopsis serialis TaxID=139415 RepID=UPI0020082FE1|nr:uncharacterized protein B0H18DRAFT_1117401 [Neoantrodia serialis]KAH9929356.1 hypothetical protein B0H18DRAFT_1117401 [Neoantrodia serialis]